MNKKWRSLAAAAIAAVGAVAFVASGPGASAAPVSNCHPSAAHPFPVVLVHGTFENSTMWSQFQPVLQNAGYCVSAIDYVSTQEISISANQLANYVNQVLARTGASKVDIVGHSQGGMMPRYYLKNLGGAAKVHQLIAFAPSNYGTTANGLATLAGPGGGVFALGEFATCPACQEQIQGSLFLLALNNGGDTRPGVSYTVIETSHDEVVTPFANAFLRGSGATNILIQNVCPADASGHIALATNDRNAWRLALNALDPAHAQSVNCVAATDPI